MALNDLLNLSKDKEKIGMSEERLAAMLPVAKEYVRFWRDYPDLFIDFLSKGTNFHMFYYQRVFLRAAARHKYFYSVFPRGYSKSFLVVMICMIRCVLYAGLKVFTTSPGKAQASAIIKEKVDEICTMIPAFAREIDRGKGKTIETKDYCQYIFKNGSYFDNIAAVEKSRGKRRHAMVGEECAGIDGKILSEVLMPILNIARNLPNGEHYDEEVTNKSQIMITTAGYRNTFAYDKLIQTLVWTIVKPNEALVMGGTWRIPVLMGLHSKSFIEDLKSDGTYNEASFNREYESYWTGTAEDSFFNYELFEKHRSLAIAEYEALSTPSKNSYYIISVDVGRKGCESVACVFRVSPSPKGAALKSLVNIFTYQDEHFETQAINLKRIFIKFKARRIIIDGNGLGAGLIDYMVQSQIDPDTEELLPPFGIDNDTEGFYNKFKTPDCIKDAIYIIKANSTINTEAHSNAQTQISSGKVKFLKDDREAKLRLLSTKKGEKMTPEERERYLIPYVNTSILRDEMMNLKQENEGINIILKQINKSIPKDKFSSFEYGLYYIRITEDIKKKKTFNAKDFLLMN